MAVKWRNERRVPGTQTQHGRGDAALPNELCREHSKRRHKQAGFLLSEGAYHSLRDRQGIALSAASVSVLGQ